MTNQALHIEPAPPRLSPTQLRTFDELLAIGGERPFAPPELVAHLAEMLEEGTRVSMDRWTERNLWAGKSLIATAHRCEGQLLADRLAAKTSAMGAPAAMGIVTHRAIQLAHTHAGRSPEEYVRLALAGANSEEDFAAFWQEAPEHIQSDLQVNAVSRVVGFLDAFPPISPNWVPRFEESIQARIGQVTLSARPDLLLGRPRSDGRQTMFICDVKSGGLREHHIDEARFYALVAALRFGCPPFRSVVFSLATGEWTEPTIDTQVLKATAQMVIDAVNANVAVLTESRPPTYSAGMHCTWCSVRDECETFSAYNEAGRPEPESQPVAVTDRNMLLASGTLVAPNQQPATKLQVVPTVTQAAPAPSGTPVERRPARTPQPPEPTTSEPSGPNPWALDA